MSTWGGEDAGGRRLKEDQDPILHLLLGRSPKHLGGTGAHLELSGGSLAGIFTIGRDRSALQEESGNENLALCLSRGF